MDEILSATVELKDAPFSKGVERILSGLSKLESQTSQIGDKIDRAFTKGKDSLGRFASSGQVAGLSLERIGGLAIKAFAIDKIVAAGKAISDVSGKYEKYEAILTNALGSRTGAQDNLRLISDFAATTPNALSEVTESFLKFVNRGLIPTKSQLTNLGDLAASQGKSFDQLTEAVLDAQTGEFERLKEFGIRASKSGDQVSLSFKGVTQTVKATNGDITNAILKFGQLNGVAGSMSSVSLTLEGQISNLGDSFDRLLVAVGNTGVTGGFKTALGAAQSLISTFTDLISNSPAEEFRNQQIEINGLVGAVVLANRNESVRLSLIQQLNQRYPEFLGKLDAEAATTDVLARRLADVNAQYERKVRIAIGEEKVKEANDKVTASIRQQTQALQQLAIESGKSLTELEKLSPSGQISLAKQVAANKRGGEFRAGYFGQTQKTTLDYLPQALEVAFKAQASAQAELNKAQQENAVRQADLTSTTIAGYRAEIAQIKEKIKLHKIDAQLGQSEINRLTGLVQVAEGRPVELSKTPIGASGVKKVPKVRAAKDEPGIGGEKWLKRLEDFLESKIQVAGGKGVDTEKQQLESVRALIDKAQALTSPNQQLGITGIKEIIDPNSDAKVKAIVDNFHDLASVAPGLFTKTGIDQFLRKTQQALPGIEYYENKVEEIQAVLLRLSLAGLELPPELLANLEQLKEAIRDAKDAAGVADATTNPGAEGETQAKWIKKAEARIKHMKATGQQVKQTVQEMAAEMQSAHDTLSDSIANALQGVGDGLAQGESPLKVALQAILGILGDFMIKIGTAMLIGGTLLTAAETAFPFLKPFLKLAKMDGPAGAIAGGALIVGGAAVKSISSHEKGGLFTGESIIRVAESSKARAGGGEWVSPVNLGADLISDRIMKNTGMNLAGPRQTSTINYRSALPNPSKVISEPGPVEFRSSISGQQIDLVWKRYKDGRGV